MTVRPDEPPRENRLRSRMLLHSSLDSARMGGVKHTITLAPGPQARFWLAVGALLVIAVAYLAGFWRDGRPAALPDVPHGKVACLSYTPRGVVPGSDSYVSAAQIEAD